MPESLQERKQKSQQEQDVIDVSDSPVKSPPRKSSVAGPSWSAKYREGRSAESPEGDDYPKSSLTVDDSYPLERSVSMPTITGGGGGDELTDSRVNTGNENGNVISDEVIQELGMWEQVIQEEKKDSSSAKQQEEKMDSSDEYQVEDVDERESAAGSPAARAVESEREQYAQTPSPTLETNSAVPAEDAHLQSQRKQSIVPSVSVQQPTPNLSAGSEADRRRQSVSEEKAQQIAARRESVGKTVEKQESFASKKAYSQEEETPEAVATPAAPTTPRSGSEEEVAVASDTQPQTEKAERQASQEGPSSDMVSPSQANEPPGDKPPSGQIKSEKKATAGVSKTGTPGPPARRLSRIPQQLYIKTTPAIPMNANIQHILANVARTEGPFEQPAEAVKAAVIALHDNAWLVLSAFSYTQIN